MKDYMDNELRQQMEHFLHGGAVRNTVDGAWRHDECELEDANQLIVKSVAALFGVGEQDITEIYPLDDGVTNQSFVFYVGGAGYVYRLPGTGTSKLINRANEKKSYEAVAPLQVADEVVFFDAQTGVKISRYYANTRIADPFSDEDLSACVQNVKKIHAHRAKVGHSFDIGRMIAYYEELATDIGAVEVPDAELAETRAKMLRLLEYERATEVERVLCHGDFAHTNVLLFEEDETACKIIDWEYSGMGDPMMDVAMFTIYAEFDRERVDLMLQMYCGAAAPTAGQRMRMYLYVALAGYLWSMWSWYKQGMGQDFGEYPAKMFQYMRDYYDILVNEGLLNQTGL